MAVLLNSLVSWSVLLMSSRGGAAEGNEESTPDSCFVPAVVQLEVLSRSTDAITFKWEPVWDDDNVTFFVRWAISDGGCVKADCKPSGVSRTTGKHFTLDQLKPFTQACLTVTPRVTASERCRGPGKSLCSRVLPLDRSIRITEVNSTAVRIGWKQQDGVSGYSVRYCTTSGPCSEVDLDAEDDSCKEKHLPGDSAELTLKNLKPWTSVLLKVMPYKSSGVECFTTRVGRPTAPRELKARNVAHSGIIVHWKPPQNPNGPISKYHVRTREQNQESHVVYEDDVEHTFFLVENVNRSLTYIIQVRAVNHDHAYRLDIWGEPAVVRVSFDKIT